MARDPWAMPIDPTEAKVWRMAGYRKLSAESLDVVHHNQVARLAAAQAEMAAIAGRWREVQAVIDTLSVTTREIEGVLLEKRRDQ